MPLHSALTGSEVHEDKLIGEALTSDAGKVTTPSASTAGQGELRRLLVTELDSDALVADSGQVWTPSSTTNGEVERRQLAPADLSAYKVATRIEFADIGTADTQWTVLMHDAHTVRFAVVLYGAISAADETVTVTVGTATGVALVVPFAASAAGTVVLSPVTQLSADQSEGVKIKVETAGTSTGATKAAVIIYTESA